ncbi:MAG: FosX/FosE/FosI family fosfomycin resistance hydrolase [Asticcacaulis sp.]
MAQGLSHITFIVRDLDKMELLLVNVFHARKVYDSGSRTFSISKERFFLVGDELGTEGASAPVWIATMQGEPLPSRTYNHVAFKIDEASYDERFEAIRALGLEVRESRPRVEGEGRSIYFHDFDNHLFELHTGTLFERLKRYAEGN